MKTSAICVLVLGLAFSLTGHTQTPSYAGKRVSTTADIKAIEKVTVDFRTALKARNVKQLSSLLLNDRILFASPSSADSVPVTGARDFLDFVATAKVPIEERYYNVKIVQDGNLAWVTFDFDFLENGKIVNYGVEVWQMIKGADGWKILSVVWSSNGPPP
jgi:ketosteroid isomerase-like protein